MQRRKTEGTVLLADDPLWYQDAVIYELHVRAFADSNGDGIGDFPGLMGKLDYLQDLGVTALWLLPFYPSPLRDDGYDIADYTTVHPAYGTLADFKAVLQAAHRRGLRIITELVLNHTSDQHPWFQRARRAEPGSPWREFYVWSETPKKYPEARIIFKDFEPSNWTWDPVAGAYYWHRFYSHQPDLNYDNPEVHRAVRNVLDFWLGLGIDGLRLDAVPYLYEREGTHCENLPPTHACLKELRRHVDKRFRNRMLLAEANQWPEDAVAYFGAGDECHMAFHFPLMPRLFMGLRMEDRFPILDILQQTPAIPPSCQWALFLRNHDELTLEMVTDEDRDYMYRLYAQDPQARINLGIRRRLAPLLENHRAKIELLCGLLLSLPGTPVIYYGDEIGMGDNIYLGDRNGVRTPMQWSAERNAGFSRANPQRLYLPVIIDPEYHYEALNVEAQHNNPHSLLWWMRRLIALRRRYRTFGRGSLEFIPANNPKVLAFVRRYSETGPGPAERDGGGEDCLLVVANLSRLVQCVELDLSAFLGRVPMEMRGRTSFPPIGAQPYFLTLGAHAFYWFSLEAPRVTGPVLPREAELPSLEVAGTWDEIVHGSARQALEDVLPVYLKRCPWFQEKTRQTEAALVLETIPVAYDSALAHVALIRVEYTEGESETYVLPLAFATGADAERVRQDLSQAVIARLTVRPRRVRDANRSEPGYLYDPLGDKPFARGLLEAIARQRRFKRAGGELRAVALPALRQFYDPEVPCPEPALLPAEQRNTAVVFDQSLILKVYRRIEEGTHPALEVGRFLRERATFHQVPAVAGMLEYGRGWGQVMILATLEEFVPNQGDAWRYTLDALSRYYEHALTRQPAEADLPLPRKPLLELVEEELPLAARDMLGSYLEGARLLGQRTAEFHVALASATDDSAFTPEPFSTLYQRSLYQSLRGQARQALEMLRKHLPGLPESARELAQELLGREEELLHRARRIFRHPITALRIRCHGDFHLGHVLYTGKDFVLIDVEGNSHRPFSDRRRKRSPLRDVADMLRSFHYAAFAAAHNGPLRQDEAPTLKPWMHFWHQWVSVTFLQAYLAVAASDTFLPASRSDRGVLLSYYLLKRAANELRADLASRSERVEVPLQGLLQLLNEEHA
jgi:maltose alpha-D-glucosyltransferase/alpha-amylase